MTSGTSSDDAANIKTVEVGSVSLDTAEIAIVDGMYLLPDEDHDAGRTPG